jgi:CRP-like cAMP-binding protein
MDQKWLGTIVKLRFFEGIDPGELSGMLGCLKPRIVHYKKKEYLAFAGDVAEAIGFVLAGTAAVVKENAAGNRTMMTTLHPGDMFGEMVAFCGKPRWPANVHALTPCTVIFLPRDKIIASCERACGGHRRLIMNLLTIISEKALLLNRKVEYLSIRSLRGKIVAFLLEQQRRTGETMFMLPLKRNELADFLGVSRPAVSRELGRMRDEGLIEFYQSSVRIIDLEGLRGMAE